MALLTLEYRPKRFADLIGQKHVTTVLTALVSGTVNPAALVFAGPRGVGKTSAARVLAAALNCEHATDGDACGDCSSCVAVQQGSSDAVIEVDAASHGGVSDVHKLRELCLYAFPGQWRVVILDEAQAMSREAYNALLRILEDPPERTLFLLLTTEKDKILPTVLSRSMVFEFRPVAPDDLMERLQYIADTETVAVSDEVIERIVMDSRGHVREAVMKLDQCGIAGVFELHEYNEKFGVVDVSLPILSAVTRGDLHAALAQVQRFFEASADISLLSQQLTKALISVAESVTGAPASAAVSEIAQRVSRERVLSALHVLWDFSGRARWASNDRALADLVVVMLGKVLSPENLGAVQTQAPAILEEEKPMSSGDVMEFLRESGLIAH